MALVVEARARDRQVGGSAVEGSVLERWSNSSLNSAANLPDDGRVYVGVSVTGPVGGLYHYEYAFHNRDNLRGIGAIHIPRVAAATLSNIGFSDIDGNAGTDWTVTETRSGSRMRSAARSAW